LTSVYWSLEAAIIDLRYTFQVCREIDKVQGSTETGPPTLEIASQPVSQVASLDSFSDRDHVQGAAISKELGLI
jgi:hypothetical protein